VLELRRLRILRELSRCGTLTAVADALGYSPSTISQQLTQLAAETGVPLLEPVGRRVRLTAAAQLLVRHTETLLSQMEQAEADLATVRTGPATVRVAAFQSAALALIPTALTQLATTVPQLRVEVTVVEPELSVPALAAREFDIALIEEYPHQPLPRRRDTERAALMADQLVLAVPSGWPTVLTELADQPWVMEPQGTHARDWSTAACRSADFEPDVRYTSADLLMHRALVDSGHAAALLPRLSGIRTNAATSVAALPGLPERHLFTTIRRGAGNQPGIIAVRTALTAARIEYEDTITPGPPTSPAPTSTAGTDLEWTSLR
jgi:DNA-binding transcriptional LysR family regulator